eukprot:UN01456
MTWIHTYTGGDADLWHYAWMLTNTLFAMSPWSGVIGDGNSPMSFASATVNTKMDMEGNIIAVT